MIAVHEIRTVRELEALRPEWSALWERCPSATPFQTPEWLLPWWESFGAGQLAAFALRADGKLAGVAPFWIDGAVLRLLGAGISDYLDVLIEPECRRAAVSVLWRHILELGWQRCEFTDLPSGSLHSGDSAAAPRSGGGAVRGMSGPDAAARAPPQPSSAISGVTAGASARWRTSRPKRWTNTSTRCSACTARDGAIAGSPAFLPIPFFRRFTAAPPQGCSQPAASCSADCGLKARWPP